MSFDRDFPDLTDISSKTTSSTDPKYNCVAWAFKDNKRWWWPSPRAYWPSAFSGLTAIQAFESWLDADGWEPTDNSEFEKGIEKLALYTKEGSPTHMARMLENGSWTSKLGQSIDISHELNDLEGPAYGSVRQLYRKCY